MDYCHPNLCVGESPHHTGMADEDSSCRKQGYLFCNDLRRKHWECRQLFRKAVLRQKLNYMGCTAVVMPENYIAMFDVPTQKESLEIIQRAEQTINEAILTIKTAKAFSRPAVTFQDRMNSGIVNNLFYPVFVHAKILCRRHLHLLWKVRQNLSAEQHTYGKQETRMGKELYPLHGLHLPLSNGSN